MTLEKAIEHLERHYVLHFDVPRAELDEAARLGIKALKAVKHNRHAFIIDYQVTLPGETKE